MNIYIYGIYGVYNYGCEAIVRSVSSQLTRIYPDSNIIYMSCDFDADKRTLEDCSTVEVKEQLPRVSERSRKSLIGKGIRFIGRTFGVQKETDIFPSKMDWLDNCDVLVIIGGDVLDVGANVHSEYNNINICAAKLAKEKGAKVIAWGISIAYSEFEQNSGAKKRMIGFFRNICDCAFIRDKDSYIYLIENGVSNAHLIPDPAFAFVEENLPSPKSKVQTIGINLSPLSNKYIKTSLSESELIAKLAIRINEIVKAVGASEVLLIPHVVTEKDKNDDDYSYLMKISNELAHMNIASDIVKDRLGFIGIRKHLHRCDMIIAARMHCAVNSVSCGIPTIFLSYSPKAIGMAEMIYGHKRFAIPMCSLLSETKYEPIIELKDSIPSINEHIAIRCAELKRETLTAGEIVETVIGRKK